MWLSIVLFVSLYALWLPTPILLLTGDQKVYIQTALEMLAQNEWWVPLHNGAPRFLKPPLHAWMMMLSFKVFGRNFFGAMFPSHLALCLSLVTLNRLRQLIGLKGSLSSPMFLLTFGAFTYAHAAQMEMWLVLAWLLSSTGFLSWLKRPSHGAALCTSAGVCMLSLLKSPLYTALWGLGAMLIGYKEMGRLIRSKLFWGYASSSLFMSSYWFGSMLTEHRDAFWYQYIQQETLEKRFGSQTSFLHLWAAFLLSCMPVALFLCFLRRIPPWSKIRILLAWTLPIFCFFSIFPYRTGTYLFPILPFFVLVLAHGLHVSRLTRRLLPWLNLLGVSFMTWLALKYQVLPLYFGISLMILALIVALFSLSYPWRGHWGVLCFPFFCLLLGRGMIWAIAEEEYAPLRKIKGEWALYEPNPTLWQETGWLSLSTREQGVYLNKLLDAEAWLNEGKTLIVDEKSLPENWKFYKRIAWERWAKRLDWQQSGTLKRTFWLLNP